MTHKLLIKVKQRLPGSPTTYVSMLCIGHGDAFWARVLLSAAQVKLQHERNLLYWQPQFSYTRITLVHMLNYSRKVVEVDFELLELCADIEFVVYGLCCLNGRKLRDKAAIYVLPLY